MADTTPTFHHSRLLRYTAIAEGVTLLLLMLIAVPLKHVFDMDILVKWLGPIHGLAFIIYIWAVFNELTIWDAPKGWVWKAVAMSFVPGGTIWFLRRSRYDSEDRG